MRFIVVAVAMTALLAALKLWTSETNEAWASTTALIAGALALMVVVGMVVAWLRDRQRRRLTDLRDSALW